MDDTASAIAPNLTLSALLPATESDRLCQALGQLLQSPVALHDASGAPLARSPAPAGDGRFALALAGHTVGYLLAPQAEATAALVAARLLEQVLAVMARSASGYRELAAVFDERVAAEVKASDERQRQSYQAERLASVGALAAGVAHEINNPIAFVRSNLGTAQTYLVKFANLAAAVRGLPGGEAALASADVAYTLEDFAELLRDSIAGIDRVAQIINDLKGFSNVDRPQEDVVDLNALLGAVCRMAEKELPPGATLSCRFGELKPLLCLPGHLSQAILAVLTNAVQAIAGKGCEGEIRVRSHFEAEQAIIEVQDNGVGIEHSALPRVFDPFYTTRAVGKGTGLGLTVARDIVRAHGGEIEFDSVLGEGTTVTVSLPD